MPLIDLSKRNFLFLGYGAVAKCTFNHMDRYVKFDTGRVHAVDQFKTAFSGPRVDELKQHVLHVTDANFDALISEIGLVPGDIILDLTYDSCSYYFIQRCLELGLNYVNTSIEDHRDKMHGTSIDCQQRQVQRVVEATAQTHPIRSNVLTECGQNPGMIQHYVFHGLREMYRLEHPEKAASLEVNAKLDHYDRETLIRVIDDCRVGSILCSEVDDQVVDNPPPVDVLTNTWSVSGFLTEALDRAELVRGRDNEWIQPKICPSMLHEETMKSYEAEQSSDYEVLFMKEQGINLTLATIAPVWQNACGTARSSDADIRAVARSASRSASLDLSIEAESESVSVSPSAASAASAASASASVRTDPEFSSCTDAHGGVLRHLPFRGKMIHHGEMFELARVFGRKAPFMSYVYSNS
jgi:homospermidine synthase